MSLTEHFKRVIDIWFDGKNRRPFLETIITEVEKNWNNKNIFVIETPTGYGKSTISATIALYSLKDEFKSIITFPLRTLLEDQFEKFKKLVNENLLGKRYMHNPDSRYLIKPITLTTIDTLALTLFGIPPEDLDKVVRYWSGTSSGSLGHYLFSWMSVVLSNIVLDEVHLLADSVKSLNFLIALMKIAIDNDQKLFLMSATIPEVFKRILEKIMSPQADKLLFIKFESKYDQEFIKERASKKYKIILTPLKKETKFNEIAKWVKEEIKKYPKVIVVFNTVNDAIKFYKRIKDEINDNVEKILLHSRFNEKDRRRKSMTLRGLNKNYIIVSTQVIEAGVDISSNLFITELAPANSLIQRLGRFLRYEGERKGKIYIWYEVDDSNILKRDPDNKYKVYDWNLSNKTLIKLQEIKDKLNIHIAESYKTLLDNVYDEKDFRVNIDEINDLTSILMNLEFGSLKAVEKFFYLEGSFVRSSLIAPVIPSNFIKKSHADYIEMNVKELSQLMIPLNFRILKKLKPCKEIILKKDKEREEEKIKVINFDSGFLFSERELIKHMIRNSVLAFVLDKSYSNEFGLVLGELNDK